MERRGEQGHRIRRRASEWKGAMEGSNERRTADDEAVRIEAAHARMKRCSAPEEETGIRIPGGRVGTDDLERTPPEDHIHPQLCPPTVKRE